MVAGSSGVREVQAWALQVEELECLLPLQPAPAPLGPAGPAAEARLDRRTNVDRRNPRAADDHRRRRRVAAVVPASRGRAARLGALEPQHAQGLLELRLVRLVLLVPGHDVTVLGGQVGLRRAVAAARAE